MELSVNSIVILVIAIVMMGLIIGFVREKFKEVSGNLITNEPDPSIATSDDRLTLSRETVPAVPGSNAVLKINVFNGYKYTYYNTSASVVCNGPTPYPIITSSYKPIQIGEMASFIVTFNFNTHTPRPSSYLCTLSIRGSLAFDKTATVTNCPAAGAGYVLSLYTIPNLLGTQIACTGVIQDITPKDFVIQIN